MAACLMFELHELNGQYYIKIWYKKSPTSNKRELLEIPDCGYLCPLDKMYDLYANILPTVDYYTACKI